jgi:hypothetical protein
VVSFTPRPFYPRGRIFLVHVKITKLAEVFPVLYSKISPLYSQKLIPGPSTEPVEFEFKFTYEYISVKSL